MRNEGQASAVRIMTESFEFSWGHKPRGRAGMWMFKSHGKMFRVMGMKSFAEARKEAVKWAARQGFREVEVCS